MNSEIRIVKAISKLTDKDKELDKKIDNCTNEIKEAETSLKNDINTSVQELENKLEQYKHDKPKDGINGKDGRNGLDGYTPVKGIDYFDGKDGINGINGRDGKDGERGFTGKDGINGKDGSDGVGIKKAFINKKGELIIILTNDKEINCGRVVGQSIAGATGISVTNAQIVDNHLIITLSDGRTIDAGEISGGGSSGITDVKVNDESVVTDNVANIDLTNYVENTDYADITNAGVIKLPYDLGFMQGENGYFQTRNIGSASMYSSADPFCIIVKGALEYRLADYQEKGKEVTMTAYTNNWLALSGKTPYKFYVRGLIQGSYDAEEIELINDNGLMFANYGFIIGAVSSANYVDIYALDIPDETITFTMVVR